MAEIFISYSQKDKARVRLIAEGLEQAGFDVFWDPEIPPGETWDNIIARELKAARCVIVAWSEASAESDWVKEEADYGKRMKALVPVQIDPSGPPLGFSRIQTANLSDWTGDPNHPEWRKVLDRVRHHGVDTSAAREMPGQETRQAGALRDALYSGGGSSASGGASDRGRTGPQASGAQPSSFQFGGSGGGGQAAFGGGAASFAPAGGGASGQGRKDPTTDFDFQYAFFQSKGRMAQKPFWIGFAILFGVSFVGGMIGAVAPAIVLLLNLALLYPSICLYGKRLHDFGMSAWVFGGFFLATFLMGAVIGGVMGASGAYPEEIMMTSGILNFLITIAFSLWVGLMKTEPQANKHGPVPGTSGAAEVFS